ncbi:MAG TPA: GNAT family N-acetyltransferase [Solirubrobacteraceae bacterium]|jgi:ribosomal protein S18 acetylase RimI-like enzyme|nr:GNAT family N-acetyltransferase [Solirubrobacteraceae bacterium]
MIRCARPDELDVILALWSAEGVRPSATDTTAALERLMEDQAEALLVAEVDDEIVGVLIAAWDGWRGNMYRLAVRPDQRRRGIGQALVEEGERRLRARGARRITALVNDDVIARASWVAYGYRNDLNVERHVKMV